MICEICDVELKQTPTNDGQFCQSCDAADVKVADVNVAASFGDQEPLQPTGKATSFQCPHCSNSKLHIGDLFGTQVCFCNECYGFVIDRMSLGQLVDKLRAAYDGPDDAPILIDPAELKVECNCPACFARMETFNYYGPGNVVLDTCEQCKLTWLNQGELGKIIRAPGRREVRKSGNFESAVLKQCLQGQASSELAAGVMLAVW